MYFPKGAFITLKAAFAYPFTPNGFGWMDISTSRGILRRYQDGYAYLYSQEGVQLYLDGLPLEFLSEDDEAVLLDQD
jgi:hypothetical protein